MKRNTEIISAASLVTVAYIAYAICGSLADNRKAEINRIDKVFETMAAEDEQRHKDSEEHSYLMKHGQHSLSYYGPQYHTMP